MGFIHGDHGATTATPETLAADHMEDARASLIKALHHLDAAGQRQVHRHVAGSVDGLDDARSLLAERCKP